MLRTRAGGVTCKNMIQTETQKSVDCPCGCERKVSKLSGQIKMDNSVPYYSAFLMNDGNGPNLWVMLHTGSWEPYKEDCAIIIQSIKEKEGLRSYLSDQNESPWKNQDIEGLHFLSRDEVLAQKGGKEWVFEIHDYFVENQNEVAKFVQ